jgi:hypothetical protein
VANKDFVVKNSLIVGDTATINGVQIDPSGATSGQVLKFDGSKFAPAADQGATDTSSYSTTIGDGNNSSYTITHDLNTRDIFVAVRDVNNPYDLTQVGWEATTVNTLKLTFSSIVSSNSRRVTVISAGSLDYFSATVGNGSSSNINIDHNLGSREVVVSLRNANSLYENIIAGVSAPTAQRVTIDFSSPPLLNSVSASVFMPSEGYSYSSTIGDGTSNSYVVTHNLNTRDIGVISRNTSTPFDMTSILWEATTLNTATIYFSSAPSTNSRKITVFSALGGSKYIPTFSEISIGVPETSSSSGNTGDIAYDSNYVYICTSANTWKRSALTTW